MFHRQSTIMAPQPRGPRHPAFVPGPFAAGGSRGVAVVVVKARMFDGGELRLVILSLVAREGPVLLRDSSRSSAIGSMRHSQVPASRLSDPTMLEEMSTPKRARTRRGAALG